MSRYINPQSQYTNTSYQRQSAASGWCVSLPGTAVLSPCLYETIWLRTCLKQIWQGGVEWDAGQKATVCVLRHPSPWQAIGVRSNLDREMPWPKKTFAFVKWRAFGKSYPEKTNAELRFTCLLPHANLSKKSQREVSLKDVHPGRHRQFCRGKL